MSWIGHALAAEINFSPNRGRPLYDDARVASSWITFQCSTSTPSAMRRMSAAIQAVGWPNPENRPWTVTGSLSATIIPDSYFSVAGILLIRLNRPSRPGAICAILADLRDKLRFIERHYAAAAAPFREIKRKIEEHEKPFEWPPFDSETEHCCAWSEC
jgi:hypothetical protein